MSVSSILAAVYGPLADDQKILFLARLAHAVTLSLRAYYLLPPLTEDYPRSKSVALNELQYEVTAQLQAHLESATARRSDTEFLEAVANGMIDCRATGTLLVVFHAAARTLPVDPAALTALQEAIDSSYHLTLDPRLESAA